MLVISLLQPSVRSLCFVLSMGMLDSHELTTTADTLFSHCRVDEKDITNFYPISQNNQQQKLLQHGKNID